jgi:hypothetical protein
MTSKTGWGKRNEDTKEATEAQGINLSLLISIYLKGLVMALSKTGGTKRWHLSTFFINAQKYLTEELEIPPTNILHIIDGCSAGKNKDFFDVAEQNKIRIMVQSP